MASKISLSSGSVENPFTAENQPLATPTLSEPLRTNPPIQESSYPIAHRAWVSLSKTEPTLKNDVAAPFLQSIEEYCKNGFAPVLREEMEREIETLKQKFPKDPSVVYAIINAAIYQLIKEYKDELNPRVDELVSSLQKEQDKLVGKKPGIKSCMSTFLKIAGVIGFYFGFGYLAKQRAFSPVKSFAELELDWEKRHPALCPLVPLGTGPYLQPLHYSSSDFSSMLAMHNLNSELQKTDLNWPAAAHLAQEFDRFGLSAIPVYAAIAERQLEDKDFDAAGKTPHKLGEIWLRSDHWTTRDRSLIDFYSCYEQPIRKSLFEFYLNKKDLEKAFKNAQSQDLETLGKVCLQEENFAVAIKMMKKLIFSRDQRIALFDDILEKAITTNKPDVVVDALTAMIDSKKSVDDDFELRYFSSVLNKLDDANFGLLRTSLETVFKKISPSNQKLLSESFIKRLQAVGDADGAARMQEHISNLDQQVLDLGVGSFRDWWVLCSKNDELKASLHKKHPQFSEKIDRSFKQAGDFIWIKTDDLLNCPWI